MASIAIADIQQNNDFLKDLNGEECQIYGGALFFAADFIVAYTLNGQVKVGGITTEYIDFSALVSFNGKGAIGEVPVSLPEVE